MDSKGYLKSYGWQEGEALKKGGLKKPVLVKHKKDTKGIGHNANDGEMWWEQLFDGQLKGLDVSVGSKGTDINFTQNKKVSDHEFRKQQSPLYQRFVKGEGLKGTINEPKPQGPQVTSVIHEDKNSKDKSSKKKSKEGKINGKNSEKKSNSKDKSKDKKLTKSKDDSSKKDKKDKKDKIKLKLEKTDKQKKDKEGKKEKAKNKKDKKDKKDKKENDKQDKKDSKRKRSEKRRRDESDSASNEKSSKRKKSKK